MTPLPGPVYNVRRASSSGPTLNGRADDRRWSHARADTRFIFPWREHPAPATEFRALYDDAWLYFAFRAHDLDLVVMETLRDRVDVVFEDRVEMFFSTDDQMTRYYCLEMDPLGRVFDYAASFYRQLDLDWQWKGLEVYGSILDDGYVVEGRVPLAGFKAMGMPLGPGGTVRCGLYRAEFSHDRSGRTIAPADRVPVCGRLPVGAPPVEEWISWVHPGTAQPDFHVPSSLGFLTLQP